MEESHDPHAQRHDICDDALTYVSPSEKSYVVMD